jgi:S1-C subfamily serine protease/Tfp pilus assembly protein PilF
VLTAAALLWALPANAQDGGPAQTGDKKPPAPTRKAADGDPPLPSKKPARVEVKAPSAEVQSGDEVIATVRRGDVLPFTRKTDGYYLVTVNGKKGWIRREDVREVGAAAGAPPDAPAAIAAETTRKVRQATAFLRVRLANGTTVEGSGFFADQPGLVFTNAHVLGMKSPGSAAPARVDVVVHSGEPQEFTLLGKVLGVDRHNDLGVVRVQAAADRLPAPLAVAGSENVSLVQKVYVFGFPFGATLGKDITVSETSVSSIRKGADGTATQIQVNGGMHPGNSGGPVVDSRGAVVGVAVAVLRNSQIHFAVPGECVQALLRGRLAEAHLAEPFRDGDQVKLPVRLDFQDPLGRLHKVRLDVWAGDATPARPPSPSRPEPLPGDGPRKAVAVGYEDGGVQVDLPVPALAGDQVLWIQPALADKAGATHWERAVAYKPSGLPPVERQPAVLRQQFDKQPQRTVKLRSHVKVRAFTGAKELMYQDVMELEALETSSAVPRGGQLNLSLGAYKVTTEANGKSQPLFPQAQALLRGRSMTYITDASGAMLQHTVPALNPPNPINLRLDFAELVEQISTTYEMTCLSVPNRKLQPQGTWQTRVPILLLNPLATGKQDRKEIIDLMLTCTYEGRRTHGGRDEAVISLTGTLRRRTPGPQLTTTTVSGKVHFAIDEGFVSLAKLTLESEGGEGGATLTHSVDVTLTRVAGNTTGIVARQLPGALGPVARGKAVLQADLALTADDPADCPGRKGCRYKVQEVEFVAGKTYVIEMDRIGPPGFDPYLILLDPADQKVAEDDDGGGNLNARLAYRAAETGTFRVYATTFAQGMTGKFRLTISEAAEGPAAKADYDLAVPFLRKRDFDRAIPHLEKAVAANPRHAKALLDLGFAYNEKGLFDKAIPCFTKVLEIEPNTAVAHNNLGVALRAKGQPDEAIREFRAAIECDPGYAVAHSNLGLSLREKGQFAEALASLKRGHELGKNQPGWKFPEQWLRQAERLADLDRRAADVLKGEVKAKNPSELLRLGGFCLTQKKAPAAAARLYADAFKAEPELADDLQAGDRYAAARAAALAGCGKGRDAADLDEPGRARWRKLALEWLRADLKAWAKRLDGADADDRAEVRTALQRWQSNPDLAGLRDAAALEKLSEAERAAWRTFWTEVEALRTRSGKPRP